MSNSLRTWNATKNVIVSTTVKQVANINMFVHSAKNPPEHYIRLIKKGLLMPSKSSGCVTKKPIIYNPYFVSVMIFICISQHERNRQIITSGDIVIMVKWGLSNTIVFKIIAIIVSSIM